MKSCTPAKAEEGLPRVVIEHSLRAPTPNIGILVPLRYGEDKPIKMKSLGESVWIWHYDANQQQSMELLDKNGCRLMTLKEALHRILHDSRFRERLQGKRFLLADSKFKMNMGEGRDLYKIGENGDLFEMNGEPGKWLALEWYKKISASGGDNPMEIELTGKCLVLYADGPPHALDTAVVGIRKKNADY